MKQKRKSQFYSAELATYFLFGKAMSTDASNNCNNTEKGVYKDHLVIKHSICTFPWGIYSILR